MRSFVEFAFEFALNSFAFAFASALYPLARKIIHVNAPMFDSFDFAMRHQARPTMSYILLVIYYSLSMGTLTVYTQAAEDTVMRARGLVPIRTRNIPNRTVHVG